jgi:hypothetical protein
VPTKGGQSSEPQRSSAVTSGVSLLSVGIALLLIVV